MQNMKDLLDRMKTWPGITFDCGEEPSHFTDRFGEIMVGVFHDWSGVERDEYLEWMQEQAAKPMGIQCQASRVALLMLKAPQ
jgi:hypothetical protein